MSLRDDDETVTFEGVTCKKMTERALLCVIDGEDHWIPLSQLDDASEVYDDTENAEGRLVISAWLGKQKGLV